MVAGLGRGWEVGVVQTGFGVTVPSLLRGSFPVIVKTEVIRELSTSEAFSSMVQKVKEGVCS